AGAGEGAAYPRHRRFVLGIDGGGWLARAEAEWGRARGKNSPAAWQAVADTFGPAFVYETARARWRLAEALAEKGQRERAEQEWEQAMETVEWLGAGPPLTAPGGPAPRGRGAAPPPPPPPPPLPAPTPPAAAGPARVAARAGGPGAARRGQQQPRDRRQAVHRAEDGERARVQHPGQARRVQPDRGRRHRPPGRRVGAGPVTLRRRGPAHPGSRWPGRRRRPGRHPASPPAGPS